jgi:DUF2934 family protein
MRKDPVLKNVTYAEIVGASTAAAALAPAAENHDPHPEEIAKLAYRLWEDRGRPEGSPEYDWFEAEELLRTGLSATAS